MTSTELIAHRERIARYALELGGKSPATIAREEMCWPVLSVIPADSESDDIDIANNTIYGLSASVFTNDPTRAYAAARFLRSGTVDQNSFRTKLELAFGGFKLSGISREGGIECGLMPYLETTATVLEVAPDISGLAH